MNRDGIPMNWKLVRLNTEHGRYGSILVPDNGDESGCL